MGILQTTVMPKVGKTRVHTRGDNVNLRVGKAVPDERAFAQPGASQVGAVPETAFRWIFSGPSNSGKTNLARWTLDNFYKRADGSSFFDRIYLFSPTAKLDPVWANLRGLRERDRVTSLKDPSKLGDIFNAAIKRTKRMGKDKAPQELVIFDDAIASTKFLNSPDFLRLFVAGRHGGISIMAMTQSYVKIPRSTRMQATAISMFPSKNTEIERLYTEHGPYTMTKKGFNAMVQEATRPTPDNTHPFFFLDATKPIERRYRRSYHEYLVPL